MEEYLELFFVVREHVVGNRKGIGGCFYGNQIVMVEHHQNELLCVCCYVEFATRMTHRGKHDVQVDFKLVLNFNSFYWVQISFLMWFWGWDRLERHGVVVIDCHDHSCFGWHFYRNFCRISYHKWIDMKDEYFLKLSRGNTLYGAILGIQIHYSHYLLLILIF